MGGQELQQQRKAIQAVSESTNIMLKKNVYRNYIQFIETAKEITHLESEMYQLSHLLFEQKSLLEVLVDTNFNDSLSEVQDEKDKQKEVVKLENFCKEYIKEKKLGFKIINLFYRKMKRKKKKQRKIGLEF